MSASLAHWLSRHPYMPYCLGYCEAPPCATQTPLTPQGINTEPHNHNISSRSFSFIHVTDTWIPIITVGIFGHRTIPGLCFQCGWGCYYTVGDTQWHRLVASVMVRWDSVHINTRSLHYTETVWCMLFTEISILHQAEPFIPRQYGMPIFKR